MHVVIPLWELFTLCYSESYKAIIVARQRCILLLVILQYGVNQYVSRYCNVNLSIRADCHSFLTVSRKVLFKENKTKYFAS